MQTIHAITVFFKLKIIVAMCKERKMKIIFMTFNKSVKIKYDLSPSVIADTV